MGGSSQRKHRPRFRTDFGAWTTKCPRTRGPRSFLAKEWRPRCVPESSRCQGCLSLGGRPREQPRGQTGWLFPAPSKVTHRCELTPAGRAGGGWHTQTTGSTWRQEQGVWDPRVLPERMGLYALEPLLPQEGVLGPVGGPGPGSGQGQSEGSWQEGGG